MAFHELLEKCDGAGRFQFLQTIFFMVCSAVVNPHSSLDNFIGATPDHRCWVDILDNDTIFHNGTGVFSQESLVRVSIPLDSNLRPEKCRRFIHPQWQLLNLNSTFSNMSEADAESCMDGWVYDKSSFLSTIVTEWDLVCDSQSLISVSKFLFMAGVLVGSIVHGYTIDSYGMVIAPYQARGVVLITGAIGISSAILGGTAFAVQNWHNLQLLYSVPMFVLFICSRWLVESARWLIVTNKPEKGLKALKKVACINGRKNTEDTLTMEVLGAAMKEEIQRAQNKSPLGSLFRSSALRRRIYILLFVRFANMMPLFGLVLHLQHLGNNVFLLQTLFGLASFLSNFVTLLLMTFLGRRINQAISLCLVGIFSLGFTYVPQEMQNLRVALSTLGVIFSAIAGIINMTYSNELLPTTTRATALGIIGIAGGIGGALAPMLMILRMYYAPLPWIIYSVIAILGGLVVLFLPETRNQPLPDTIQDLENKRKGSRQGKLDDAPIKVTSF